MKVVADRPWLPGVPNAKLMAELEEADAGGKAEKRIKAKLRWLRIANIWRRTDKGDMERAFGPKVVGLGLPPPVGP